MEQLSNTGPLITALYERLSRDDEQEGESNSITNQKRQLESYAGEHGFTNCKHYTDDGFSGGNFERPGWKQLVADIDAGKVGVVIAKDLSRVGRDYVETGFYTEVYFRQKGIRFIAIGNSVDTSNPVRVRKQADRTDQFLALARKYRDCTEITDDMIRAFVEKIVVHKTVRSATGQKTRQIEVHLSFIGQFIFPKEAQEVDGEQ